MEIYLALTKSIHEFFIMGYYDLVSITSNEQLKRIIDREVKTYHCTRPITYSNSQSAESFSV